jgi:hypothetical protein
MAGSGLDRTARRTTVTAVTTTTMRTAHLSAVRDIGPPYATDGDAPEARSGHVKVTARLFLGDLRAGTAGNPDGRDEGDARASIGSPGMAPPTPPIR